MSINCDIEERLGLEDEEQDDSDQEKTETSDITAKTAQK